MTTPDKKPLKELFAAAIRQRQRREAKIKADHDRELAEWLPKSVDHNLWRARHAAEHTGGWTQIYGVRNGVDDMRPDATTAHPRRDELLKELGKIGESEGFQIIPSPPGVIPGWWMVWDTEAWEALGGTAPSTLGAAPREDLE